MANAVIKKIIAYEQVFAQRRHFSDISAIAMANIYCMGHFISRSKEFLHKALFVVNSQILVSSDINLLFTKCQIFYTLGNS